MTFEPCKPEFLAAIEAIPVLPLFESARADAESSVEISIALAVQVAGVLVLQLIAVVTVKLCGPVPAGGAIPGVIFTVKRHVVFEGTMTPLSARRIVKLPGAPVPGDVGQPRPIGEVCVVKPPPFNVALAPPAVTSCAEMVPQEYFSPLGSVIVPVTVVKPPWPIAGKAEIKKKTAPKIFRSNVPSMAQSSREFPRWWCSALRPLALRKSRFAAA